MADAAQYIDNLRRIGRLNRLLVQQAVGILNPRRASSGLDVACGIGLDTCLLGERVGPEGHITGLDISLEMLDTARKQAVQAPHPKVFDFRQGRLDELPFQDASFDWIWCKDAFWPIADMLNDPIAGLEEFARVLRPGGSVALLFWTSQKLLSGYPELEARLNLEMTQVMPYLKNVPPKRHFPRAYGWLREAGFVDVEVQGLSTCVGGPMDEDLQDSMTCVFDMFYSEMQSRLSATDWSLLHKLVSPTSPDYLPRRTDYCCSFDYLIFHGRTSKVS